MSDVKNSNGEKTKIDSTGAQILNHEYDGIQELDNPLPRWWLVTFYGTMVFGALYFGYYEFGPGRSSMQETLSDLAELDAMKAVAPKEEQTDDTFIALLKDSKAMELGAKVYLEKCVSCHSEKGGGGIGPNLTDKFWIHGNGTPLAIADVVGAGVADKGMPPWKALLKKEELSTVVAYVYSLKGSHPNNPKAPQGNEIKD